MRRPVLPWKMHPLPEGAYSRAIHRSCRSCGHPCLLLFLASLGLSRVEPDAYEFRDPINHAILLLHKLAQYRICAFLQLSKISMYVCLEVPENFDFR